MHSRSGESRARHVAGASRHRLPLYTRTEHEHRAQAAGLTPTARYDGLSLGRLTHRSGALSVHTGCPSRCTPSCRD